MESSDSTGPPAHDGALPPDRYAIVRELARSRYVVTRLARDTTTGTLVVVKSLAISGVDDRKVIELFIREAETLAALSHPRVPRFVEIVRANDGDLLHLVQEYVEGETLQDLVRQGRRFTESEGIELAEELAAILDTLHRMQPPVIHRDLKPSNVVIGADGKPHLIDFGGVRDRLARERGVDDEGFTIVGTWGYMPYEQFEGNAVPASDLYALGVTLVFALSHKEPADLERKGMRLDFAGALNVSPAFERVLARMTEARAEDRYQNAAELIADLRDVRQPWRRSLRRAPLVAGGALAAGALLVVLSGRLAEPPIEPAPTTVEQPAVRDLRQPWPSDPAPSLEAPPAGAPLSAAFAVLFDGRRVTERTTVEPRVWVGDRIANAHASAAIRYVDGRVEIYGLAPGTYSVGMRFDANADNPSGYPGDLYIFHQFDVSADVTTEAEIHVVEVIHLRAPQDNGVLMDGMHEKCEGKPAFASPVRFGWGPLMEGAEFRFHVRRVVCEPFRYDEIVASGTTQQLGVELQLEPSRPGEFYLLDLSATRDGRGVGYIMAHGLGVTGWDYRFRVTQEAK